MDKFEQFVSEKGFAESTIYLYKAAVAAYENLQGLSMNDLIEEADNEEEQGVRWKHRKLKSRLISYRKWLFENKSEGTAKQYFQRIKTIYRHYEMELQTLPSYSSKQIDKTYEKTFEDIPNHDELIQAYHEASNTMKCFILFASSSGMSRIDILNLKVADFINACEDYCNLNDSLREQLNQIRVSEEPVIPYFKGTRQKTGSLYTTFCSPEAVEHITQYLLGRDASIRKKYEKASEDDRFELPCKLEPFDKLLKIDAQYVVHQFQKINTKLEFGIVGKYSKVRSHQLRAFQATTLKNLEEVEWSVDEIDALQGRKKNKTHRAYFTESVSKLRKKYVDSVDSLMLFKSIHKIDSQEYNELKAENKVYKDKLAEQEEKINQIMANLEELEPLLKI